MGNDQFVHLDSVVLPNLRALDVIIALNPLSLVCPNFGNTPTMRLLCYYMEVVHVTRNLLTFINSCLCYVPEVFWSKIIANEELGRHMGPWMMSFRVKFNKMNSHSCAMHI